MSPLVTAHELSKQDSEREIDCLAYWWSVAERFGYSIQLYFIINEVVNRNSDEASVSKKN